MNTLHVNYFWLGLFYVGLSASFNPVGLLAQSPTVIDFNPDNGRSDVVTRGVFNWPIGTVASAEQTIDGLTIRLKAEGASDARLAFDWWKGGYDYGASFVSDGVSTERADQTIRLTISGLKPGSHTLTTWHNWLAAAPASGSFFIEHGQQRIEVQPSHLVTHDDDAQTVHLSFHQSGTEDCEVIFRANQGQRVVLNGLAIDGINPALQIRRPLPADGDGHVPEHPTLTWQAPPISVARGDSQARGSKSITSYQVYFGTDAARIAQAKTDSPEYLGGTKSLSQPLRNHRSPDGGPVQANDPLREYFWRVDTVSSDGQVTPGKLLRFKIRALAFPTAEGYGRFAIGGRGGRVIEVTTLADSGPGSLREAIEASGPRTIVFRVAGNIALKSKLIIRNPYVTIAGQTAPGDGICVRGYTFGALGAHDVIMRYMRIRIGDESGETQDGTGFASADHSIYDHCSVSWSIDEAVSSRSAKNITLQRTIVAEALNIANHRKYQPGKGHSFAASISGDVGSFHHNLLVHCAGRNWSLAGGLNRGGKFAGRLDIRNNVVYNWQHRTNDGGVKALNLVNNLYLPGPASKVFHLLKPDAGSPEDPQQYYVSGNSMPGKFTADGDNWAEAVQVDAKLLPQIKLEQPFCESHVVTHTTNELLENILADVGDNHAGWDRVDQRLIDEVRQRSTTFKGSRSGLPGIIDTQTDVGGWPELKPAEPQPDSDHDGMSDAWELEHGLDPKLDDHNSPMNGGPTALEVYLNHLATRTRTSSK